MMETFNLVDLLYLVAIYAAGAYTGKWMKNAINKIIKWFDGLF